MMMLSLPLRSNSWLSASTINRAAKAAGAAVTAATGSAAGATAGSGAGAGTASGTGFAAGAPSKLTPQFEQKASPAGFSAPHDGHCWVLPAAAGAGWLTAAALASGATLASGSPHSSQKAEPSGFSWCKEQYTAILLYPP